ncbi:MAG: transporter substrate-binding domain-containing protein [Caldilinea sp.]|nr:transporter substrate-binding domain-containing protein [Caldilineaceae bacterium]MCW5840875.1 transporter substrate-binding domain-containing protein [Caldilinea sp.]
MRSRMMSPARVLMILVAMVALSLLAACRPVDQPPAVPEPLDPAAEWQRIVDSGRLVVGTSADYPPFEYYTENFQIDGFDAALIRAMAEQLGLEVQFRDMAFDGLGESLALGEVDTVIAAVSQTPERARLIDFTNTYFVSSDGYLASATGSTLEVKTLDDLKGLRVGVQRGSIFEDQVEKNLVDTEFIPARNVILYDDLSGAVRDLDRGRVDVIVLDLPAAKRFAEAGEARIAGEGINKQRYGIAVPKGSSVLLDNLNSALTTLQGRGVVARLAEQYLGIAPEDLEPIPPDPVPPAPGNPPELENCANSMGWVADLSYDDQNMTAPPVMFPGQPFTKSWRIRNTGTCTWDSTYYLDFARGNAPGARMGGTPTNIRGSVAPGATYDMSVNLVAPLLPGVYQGFWEMHTGAGRAFGQTLWVGVNVAGAPTPTPMPTQTPVPGIVFYADRTNIVSGEPVTFFWQVDNVREVYFYADGDDWRDNGVAGTGQQTEYPDRTTTYNLRVVQRDGSVEVRSITVSVQQGSGPSIDFFAVVPNDRVPPGTCVDISWRVSGDGPAISLARDATALWEDAPLQANLQDCLQNEGTYVYKITATNGAGTDTQQETVTVVATAPTPPPVEGPIIDTFSVTPESVPVNGCVVVAWNVGGDVQSLRILRNNDILLDGAPPTGSGQNCLTEAGDFEYRLDAFSSTGQSASSSATVTVIAPVQPIEPPVGGAGVDPALTGSTWTLISLFDGAGAMVSPIAGTQITANFSDDGALAGSAGCNDYTGSANTVAGTISIATGAATRKFCAEPAGIMDQEALYLALLPTAATYTVENGQLTLAAGNGQPVAIYVAAQ